MAVEIYGPHGPIGPPGEDGLVWRGAWVTATVYAKDDAVSHGGSSYIATTAHTAAAATEPGVGVDWATVWQVVAAKGAQGDPGVNGTNGATTLDALTDVDVSTVAPTDQQALVYDLASTLWKPGSVAAGGGGATSSTTTVVKASDWVGVAGSAVLANDPELKIALAANSRYKFTCVVQYYGENTGDIKVKMAAPAGATGWFGPSGALWNSAGTVTHFLTVDISGVGTIVTAAQSGPPGYLLTLHGYVETGATAGDLQFQAAKQLSGGAVSLVIMEGSTLEATKV